MEYAVAIEGLDDLDFENAPARVKQMASRAINYSLRRTRTAASKEMRRQIAFKARYLTGAEGRLKVATYASTGSLEGVLRGRDRPTSLATFIQGSRRPGRRGVTVKVDGQGTKKMRRAFVMKLKNENVGLALRLRPGERVEGKKKQIRAAYSSNSRFRRTESRKASDFNLYLLYGPSVDQVFRFVAEDVSDDAGVLMEQEFIRLTEKLL